ncbi:alkaline shock response membrane anchor protein AmaP [Streptomyces sp. NPDC055722]
MTPRSTVNRILLALAGLVLLAGGLLVLAAGLDLYRRRHLAPPAGWPLTGEDDVLLGSRDRLAWSSQGWWWWPAVIAVLLLIALAALWWLLRQLYPRRHPGRMPLGGTPPPEGVGLRDRALAEAIAADSAGLPGIQQAHARLTGRATRPHVLIDLTLASDASPARILEDLAHGPVERARRSTGWPRLPADVRLRVASHKPRRTQ